MVLVSSRYEILKKGDRAADFLLPGADGKDYSLRSFSDARAFLIIFMCNHCPYVKPKIDYIVDLQKRYGQKGLQIIAINSNDPLNYPEDSLEGMRQTSKEKNFNFPYLVDKNQEVAKKYGAMCTPDPYLFDQNRVLVYHGRVDDAHRLSHKEAKTSELEDALSQLLSSKEVSVPSIPSMGCSIKWTPGREPKYFLDALIK